MPFPKDVSHAGEYVGTGDYITITDYEGQDLLLKEVHTEDSPEYGTRVHLLCETEGGEEITITTYSGVVLDQASKLAEHLPVVITPRKQGRYYTLA